MYIADLTPGPVLSDEERARDAAWLDYLASVTPDAAFLTKLPVLPVGWLDKEHPFPTEAPDPEVVYKLGQTLWDRENFMMGYHVCEFCEVPSPGFGVTVDNVPGILGSSTILVPGDGVMYSCPDLIFHYVRDHHYRPPDEFLLAVRRYEHRRK